MPSPFRDRIVPRLLITLLAALLLASRPGSLSAQAPAPPPTNLPRAEPDTPSTPVQNPFQALAEDAAAYARRHNVPATTAFVRLRAQEESVPATDALQLEFEERLAGLAIEHAPIYRIVVKLTGTDPVPDRTISAGGLTIPVVFRTGAPATRIEILAAIRLHQSELNQTLMSAPGMGVDPRTGKLLVLVKPSEVRVDGLKALIDKLTAIAGVPVELRAWDRADVDLAVEGGARLVGPDPADGKYYACTSGFVVTDGARDGVITAAHCPDNLTYVDPRLGKTPLGFVSQWGARHQDVQVHVTDAKLEPLFYADTDKSVSRPLTSWRPRLSTRAGDFVCHRGERTGYSCADVEFVDFAPPGDLCAGPCAASWVAVNGPGCRSGDSGGPVFSETIAFGIVKGASYARNGTCGLYYYMSVDYLPNGWRLALKR